MVYCQFSCNQCFFFNYWKYVINLNNNDDVVVTEIHEEKFIKFKTLKKKKKTHQEKELHNLLRLGK